MAGATDDDPLGLFAEEPEEVVHGRSVPFHMSEEGLRPGVLSSGGVGDRAGIAAPKDAQSAELSASLGRVPHGPSGSGWQGGLSAVLQAAAGGA
eukprot:11306830-Alexandrium_andersonii.AAC.1